MNIRMIIQPGIINGMGAGYACYRRRLQRRLQRPINRGTREQLPLLTLYKSSTSRSRSCKGLFTLLKQPRLKVNSNPPGIYIVVQLGDLVQIWGNLPLMVSTSFVLFTNFAFAAKIFTIGWRSKAIQHIIDDGDREMRAEDTEEGKEIIKE